MQLDPELSAMNEVLEVFKYLRQDERIRITDWLKARFNLIDHHPPKETPAAATPVTVEPPAPPVPPTPSEPPSVPGPGVPISETGAPEEIRPEEIETPIVEEEKPGRPPKTETTAVNFEEFDDIEELFLTSDVKKVSHRILLAAAYLQEKNNLAEVSSLDINTQLKKLGYGVTNITTLINGLLKKKPPLMEVTKKEGTTKQARRKFKVTAPGFDVAKNFVKET